MARKTAGSVTHQAPAFPAASLPSAGPRPMKVVIQEPKPTLPGDDTNIQHTGVGMTTSFPPPGGKGSDNGLSTLKNVAKKGGHHMGSGPSGF